MLFFELNYYFIIMFANCVELLNEFIRYSFLAIANNRQQAIFDMVILIVIIIIFAFIKDNGNREQVDIDSYTLHVDKTWNETMISKLNMFVIYYRGYSNQEYEQKYPCHSIELVRLTTTYVCRLSTLLLFASVGFLFQF